QAEGRAGRAERTVVEWHPRVAHVAEDRRVQPAQVDRKRPGSGLDVEQRQTIFERAQDVRLARERIRDESAQEANRRRGGIQDGADGIAGVETAELEEVPLREVAARH